jgi:hypothetical protein
LHLNTNDILNKKFGRLKVIEITDRRSPKGEIYWLCKCDCGNSKIIKGTHLTRNKRGIRSCGCLQKEVGIRNIKFGKDNPAWKGDLAISRDRALHRKEELKWSNIIKKRDNYICQYCHKVGSKLNSHHIKSYEKYPEFRYEISNGITLCQDCHIYVHKYFNVLSQN